MYLRIFETLFVSDFLYAFQFLSTNFDSWLQSSQKGCLEVTILVKGAKTVT